ncbi:MAG TPA: hypothetical protein VK818_12585, partial [Methylomirabilota bacterium]|nr:hypothetical protein [Methylomirabilota bacterium]
FPLPPRTIGEQKAKVNTFHRHFIEAEFAPCRNTIHNMPSDPNRRVPPLHAWLWAIVWSTLFTAFFLAMLSSDSCFFLINSREYVLDDYGSCVDLAVSIFPVRQSWSLRFASLLSAGRFPDLASRSVPISGCGSPSGR